MTKSQVTAKRQKSNSNSRTEDDVVLQDTEVGLSKYIGKKGSSYNTAQRPAKKLNNT